MVPIIIRLINKYNDSLNPFEFKLFIIKKIFKINDIIITPHINNIKLYCPCFSRFE